MLDPLDAQKVCEADVPTAANGVKQHALEAGGQAVEEIGTEVAAHVLESVFVTAPKKVAETAVCAIVDGLGSI